MNRQRIKNYKTLVEVIRDKSETGTANGITFIDSLDGETFISYRELYENALNVLYNFRRRGINPGSQMVLQAANNLNFLTIFWACILGNIIPVPVAAAFIERHRFKLVNIWKILDNPYLIISKKDIPGWEQFSTGNNLEQWLAAVKQKTLYIEDMKQEDGRAEIHYPDEAGTAFIQFSSGSTSQPKGVVLTHKNLAVNIRDLEKTLQSPTGEERFLSWMPLTHDMGLIALHLVPTAAGWNQVLMSTGLFTRYPSMWLKKISAHKITLSGSPNSGFKHILRYFSPGKYDGIDLSTLRIILNGAEPISAALCNEFTRALAPYGLKKTAVMPSYGLAEASVAVSLSRPADEIREIYTDRNSLSIGQKIIEVHGDTPNAASFVEVGPPVDNCSVRIVSDKNEVYGDGIVGHIQVKGDNVTSGYYNDKEATSMVITADGWLDTGDLGFFKGGRLVITGRVKDTIFVNGVTYYAHDIEFVCEELEELKRSRVAVCGVYNPRQQGDEIICFITYKKNDLEDFRALARAIRKQVVKKAGAPVSRVIPVKQIPTTTSGKIQRYRLKESYLRGEFNSFIQETDKN